MPDILKAQKKEKVFTWKGEIIMYEDNDMRKDDSFATGSYYDTSSSYTHYDSAEAMKQPKKPKKKADSEKRSPSAWYWRWCSAAYPEPRSQAFVTRADS